MLSLFGAATEKLEAATIHGDLDHGVQFIGQSQGLIREIESVQTLMNNMMAQATEVHSRISNSTAK